MWIRRWFRSKITKLLITHDDRYLLAASADGTLLICEIVHSEMKHDTNAINTFDDVIVSRDDLMNKNLKICELEKVLADTLNESEQMNKQEEVFHSEHLKEVHTKYCEALDKLKLVNMEMEEKHENQIEHFQYAMDDLRNGHKEELQQLEEQLKLEIGKEYAKGQEIRAQMEDMRLLQQKQLEESYNNLQETVQALEIDFKKQLEERQCLLRDIMTEMDNKKSEFAEYCRTTNIDHDRHVWGMKCEYEQKIKELGDALTDAKLKVAILEKRLSDAAVNFDEIEKEKLLIQQVHHNGQRRLKQLANDADELRCEIRDRDHVIRDRETRFKMCEKRNQELEKHKTVLNYKIDELNKAVEPRDKEIGLKMAQIARLKDEIENLVKHEIKLELKLNSRNDQLKASNVELVHEREKRRGLEALLNRIYRDIYLLSRETTNDKEFKRHVVTFYHK